MLGRDAQRADDRVQIGLPGEPLRPRGEEVVATDPEGGDERPLFAGLADGRRKADEHGRELVVAAEDPVHEVASAAPFVDGVHGSGARPGATVADDGSRRRPEGSFTFDRRPAVRSRVEPSPDPRNRVGGALGGDVVSSV